MMNTLNKVEQDDDTVALYPFDEGEGNEAHSACGETSLTLRAEQAEWGRRPGGGAVARFARREDDANVFVGPVNHGKLQLRPCTEEWTVEAWIRLVGPCGKEKQGTTYVNLCATDDEGLGLNGIRGGWIFALANHDRICGGADGQEGQPHNALEEDGVAPSARFMGSLRGRDPNHDTAGMMYPRDDQAGTAYAGVDRDQFIHDNDWHHVAWQFRYADQTNYFFIDGQLVTKLQLPTPQNPWREIINDGICGVPFTVGGFVHSQDPPYHLGYGNFDGELAGLRISSVMRYPVAEELSIVKHRGPVADDLNLVAGVDLPYSIRFEADAAQGAVRWDISEGELPDGLRLDPSTGEVSGRPARPTSPREVTLEARDESGNTDHHTVSFAVESPRISTTSLPPAFADDTYSVALETEHLAGPMQWEVTDGELPEGLSLESADGTIAGTPSAAAGERMAFRVRVTDARGVSLEQDLTLSVLSDELSRIKPDDDTVFLYDWQDPEPRLIHDRMGDEDLALDWTNMGGDRRVSWPGREGRFPQETGHGEHGFVSVVTNDDKHNLRTCDDEWTVEAWVRHGGPFQAFGREATEHTRPFDYGHICGTYDNTERGVWELYLSNHDSPDGSMAPGVHFLGAEPDQALEDLHPWSRPDGIVGEVSDAGIRDTEWHHVAWQYCAASDEHELYLDERLIWRMQSPDGRRLVNNRQHDAQFSVFSRITGYVVRGMDENGEKTSNFNWIGWGNFFGQIGEIRVSNVRRLDRKKTGH